MVVQIFVQNCLLCLLERAPGLLVLSAYTVDRGHSGDAIRDGNPSGSPSQKKESLGSGHSRVDLVFEPRSRRSLRLRPGEGSCF